MSADRGPLSVRRAAVADAGAIARVHVRSWQAGYRGLLSGGELEGPPEAQREAIWREVLEQEGGPVVLVAEHDEAIVGFCAVATQSRDADAAGDVAEIGALYVEPRAWRAGVGRALIDEALKPLRSGPWREVTLWVMSGNERAHRFYERAGFSADGARRSDRAGTEVRLRASLER
ncbi:MAG TPA: GNAT family N-acetyltransferase [Solirubrobacteraceae bacterium]